MAALQHVHLWCHGCSGGQSFTEQWNESLRWHTATDVEQLHTRTYIYIHTYKRQREMYTIICIYIHTYINYINIVIWYMNTCGTSFCLMGRCLCDRAAMLWPLRILNTAPWAAWTQSPKQNPKTQTTSPLASYIPLFDNHALDLADGDCQTVGCC